MKVCIFNHNIVWTGGTFNRCLGFAISLAGRGHQVTLATTSANARMGIRRELHRGVSVVEFPALLGGRARSGWDVLDALRRLMAVMRYSMGQPDVIHAFDCRPTVILPALLLARTAQAPLVIDWADWWGRGGTIETRDMKKIVRFLVRGPETWFEESFRTRATRTTVISSGLADRVHSLGVPRETITLLPQGCDTENITPREAWDARRRLGLPSDPPIIGYAGTLLTSDSDLLVRVFHSIRTRNADARLLLIGHQRARLPDVPGMIRAGFVPRDKLSDYLGACDLLVLPMADTIANRGRWPSKVNDYFSSGRPTVSTPVGDVQFVLTGRSVGALGQVEDSSFASVCQTLIDDPQKRTEMGLNARRLAENDLSWYRLGDLLLNVYQSATRTGE